MTMTDSLDGLIERVERCTAPDREIDGLIACEFRIHPFGPFHWFNRSLDVRLVSYGGDVWMSDDTNGKFPGSSFQASAYTGSIEAALALAERKLPGWSWKLVHEGGRYTFLLRDAPRLEIVAPAWVHSREQPALAIILATLRALQSIKTSETPT